MKITDCAEKRNATWWCSLRCWLLSPSQQYGLQLALATLHGSPLCTEEGGYRWPVSGAGPDPSYPSSLALRLRCAACVLQPQDTPSLLMLIETPECNSLLTPMIKSLSSPCLYRKMHHEFLMWISFLVDSRSDKKTVSICKTDGNGVILARTGSAQCAVSLINATQPRVPYIKRDLRGFKIICIFFFLCCDSS